MDEFDSYEVEEVGHWLYTDILSPVALSACYMGLVWVRDKLKSIASTKVVTHLLPLHA